MHLVLRIGFFILLPFIGISQVIADFEANTTTGCGALQVVFIDKSTSPSSQIVAWSWDLSGLTSDKQNPGRIFDKPGSYKICLTVTNAAGQTNTICKENYINIYQKPDPNFLIDKDKGCVPFDVKFTDLSKSPNGNIVEWTWDIGGNANVIKTGDPTTPIFSTYSFAGLYSMSLSIKDDKGCEATVSKKDLLNVFAVPTPAIKKTFLQSCELPWLVKLENLNADSGSDYQWNLGNGQVGTGLTPPLAVFNNKGSYNLALIIHKGECTDTFNYDGYVNTNPKKEIVTEKQDYCIGEEIQFKDLSELGADSVKWVFEDGNFSSALNPLHSYQKEGCYKVKLYRWRGNCKDTLEKNCVNVLAKPVPDIQIINQQACQIPVTVQADGKTPGQYTWNLTGGGLDIKDDQKATSFNIKKFGTYQLHIVFTDANGCKADIDKSIEIKKFEANLPFQFIGGCVPYQVNLGDSVVTDIPIVQYKWEVGNPVFFTSAQKNPGFLLTNIGTYDVKLTVTNAFGCRDTVIREDFVQGGTPPTVDFLVSPIDDCLNVERTFSQNCSSNANYWVWNFGDMDGGSGSVVNHLYGQPGLYDVTLTAFHNGCPAVKTVSELIKVLAPVSNYDITFQCDEPYTVLLNNLSLGADSLYWVVANTLRSDTIRDSILTQFTFPDRGEYTIRIFSKNFTTGCIHERIDTIRITDPVARYNPDTLRGCVPLTIKFQDLSIDAEHISYSFNGIDTLEQAEFTFSQSGLQKLPWMYIKDIHDCIDSFQYAEEVMVNAIKPQLIFPAIACVPQEIDITHNSRDSFANIISLEWRLPTDTLVNVDSVALYIDQPGYESIFLKLTDDWGCTDSILMKDAIQGVLLETGFTADTLGCTNQEVLFVPKGDNVNTSGYLWTFGDGQSAATGITRHLYQDEGVFDVCLTLYDIRGCQNTHCEPAWIDVKNPVASFSGDPLFETCPPLLTRFTNASQNAIAYQWDFGDQSGVSFVSDPSHIYFEPDTFDVSLIAIRSNVCKDTLTLKDYVMVLGPRGNFNFDIIGNCTPLQVRFTANSDDYYRYYWDFGNGEVDSSLLLQNYDEKIFTYTASGIYSPKLIISDNAGCKRNFTNEDIHVNQIQLKLESIADPLCGLPSTLNVNNGSVSTSEATYYQWSVIGNGDTSQYSGYKIAPVINAYGIYNLILTAHTDNCSDTLKIDDFAGVYPNPKTGFNWESNPCQYNTLQFTNTSFIESGSLTQHEWKIENQTFSDINLGYDFQTAGTKTVSLTTTSDVGCKSESLQTLEILPNHKILAGPDTLICTGDSASLYFKVLTPNIGGTNQWTTQINTVCSACDGAKVFPPDTTWYYAIFTANNGCIAKDSTLVMVAPEPAPGISLLSDTILCKGLKATLAVINPNPAFRYEWKGINLGPCTANCQSISILPEQSSYYQAKAINQYGCSGKDSIFVEVEATIPDYLINQKYICEDSTTRLFATGVKTISWNLGDQQLCAGCDTLIVSPAGNTLYTVHVESANGCPYTDKIAVNVVPQNSIEAGEDLQICLGEKVNLHGSGIGNASWYYANQLLASEYKPTLAPQASGQYILETRQDECVLNDSLYIEVLTRSEITAHGDTVCPGNPLILNASGLAYQYSWFFDGKKLSNGDEIQIIPDTSIYLTVIGRRTTCIPDTETIFVYVHPKIDYTLQAQAYDLYFNSKVTIKALYPASGINYAYSWSPSIGMNCASCPEPTIKEISESTIYTVLATDLETGCYSEQQVAIDLLTRCSEEGYYIPNILYMYGNQSNQSFFTKAANPEEFKSIIIRDRWGNIVYQTENIDAVWDAKINGRPLESGVYTYVVQAYCPELDEDYYFAGDLTILK